jgi:putative tricarboxylic transport membrane protein
MHRIRSQRDFAGGLVLAVLGVAVLWLTSELRVGRATNMGPGYLPRLLAWLVLGVGLLIALRAFFAHHEDRLERWPWWRMAAVLVPIVIFGYTVKAIGLVASGAVLCFLSALAAHDRKLGEALAFAILLPLAAAALFIFGLGLPLSIWPDPRELASIWAN